jgi:hypothetical protein
MKSLDTKDTGKTYVEIAEEDHKPDFHTWARAPYWSASESLLLTFGKNPHAVVWTEKDMAGTSDFARHHDRIREQIQTAQRHKELSERIRPVEFLAWAKQHKIEFPDELEKAISVNELDIAQLHQRYEELEQRLRAENQKLRYELDRLRSASAPQPKESTKEPSTRVRGTLNKLIIAMALEGYRWDPKAARSKATTDISTDLEKHGLKLDQGIILKYLREAAEELP